MNIDPSKFILTEQEFDTMQTILNDAEKRRALFMILESELLYTDVSNEDAKELERVQRQLKQM